MTTTNADTNFPVVAEAANMTEEKLVKLAKDAFSQKLYRRARFYYSHAIVSNIYTILWIVAVM
jgi:hypothetical protein